jgi:hypothetical protein
MNNPREIAESVIVFNTAAVEGIMTHLDRTWWLGDDVPARLTQLREHLTAAVQGVDDYLALPAAGAAKGNAELAERGNADER